MTVHLPAVAVGFWAAGTLVLVLNTLRLLEEKETYRSIAESCSKYDNRIIAIRDDSNDEK